MQTKLQQMWISIILSFYKVEQNICDWSNGTNYLKDSNFEFYFHADKILVIDGRDYFLMISFKMDFF
jgi:hypothetical protein